MVGLAEEPSMKITVLDQEFLGTPHVIASYLVPCPDGYVLVETGPATTQAVLESKVKALGIALEEVKHVLVTHIHLDHSGGAGYWAQRGAQVYVHERGARHLIQPERLLASAEMIYKDKMEYLWGKTLPVPEPQVTVVREGVHEIGGIQIQVWDSPGHARHHLAFQVGDNLFCGDVGGCKLPGLDYVSVPGPPPEFDLEAWLTTIEKLRVSGAENLHLTHFGSVEGPASEHWDALEDGLKACTDKVRTLMSLPMEEQIERYQAWDRERAREVGVDEQSYSAYEKANPIFMSVSGIGRYWSKKAEAT